MRMTSGRHSVSLPYPQQTDESSHLRRVASTDQMSHVPSDITETNNHDSNVMRISPTKRWSSMQNVSGHQQSRLEQDYREMLVDTDPTFDQTRFIQTADDPRDNDLRYKQMMLSHPHHDVPYTSQVSPYSIRTSSAVSPHGTGSVTSSGSYLGIPNAHLFKTPKISSTHYHQERHTYAQPEISQSGYTHSSVSPRSVSSDADPSHVTHSSGSGYYSPANSDVYSDITSWQQRHRDQLKRQHQDVLQVCQSFLVDLLPSIK